jgi:phosphoribosyl-AMP cyclohydrolase / phosphoribosyl-ATP pyrophosphohydrolase
MIFKSPPVNPDFTKSADGLLPAIIQDASSKEVLMLGYMNEMAYSLTLSSGKVTFFSRSRNKLWTKGLTSGNFFDVVELRVDCDQDTILVQVNPHGPACHRGTTTCFD